MNANVQERIAYLKGLAEGLELDASKKENKLLLAMLDVLGEIGQSIRELSDEQADISEYLDEVVADMSDLLEDDDEDEDEDGDDEDDLDGEEDDEPFIEYECPNCLNTIYYDAKDFDLTRDIKCPNCKKPLFEDHTEDGDKPE